MIPGTPSPSPTPLVPLTFPDGFRHVSWFQGVESAPQVQELLQEQVSLLRDVNRNVAFGDVVLMLILAVLLLRWALR